MQQGGQDTAVGVVLQQVLHQRERGSASLLSMLLPVASLRPWQHKDVNMCHEVDTDSQLSDRHTHTFVCMHSQIISIWKQTGVNLRTFKL